MPKDLFAEDRQVEQEEALRRADMFHLLRSIVRELELMEHPSWAFFRERLERLQVSETEKLISGGDAEAARGRIKLLRYLLGLEEELRTKAAELRDELESPGEDYE